MTYYLWYINRPLLDFRALRGRVRSLEGKVQLLLVVYRLVLVAARSSYASLGGVGPGGGVDVDLTIRLLFCQS